WLTRIHARPIKRSLSDGDLSSFSKKKKKAKHYDPDLFPVNLPPIRCSVSDGDILSRTKKDSKDHSLSLLPPANTVTAPVFNSFPKPDPKVILDKAWGMLKPAIQSIFLDEPNDFCYSAIYNAVYKAWMIDSGEALFNLVLEECGTHISASMESLRGHCNDDPSVFLPLLEKCRVEYGSKMRLLCSITGSERFRVEGRGLWEFGLELFTTRLCLASQVRDKVTAYVLGMIRDQRSGKSVDINAESVQALAQSDLPKYLKHVERRLREEEEICNSLYFFSNIREEAIEIVEREFLGVRASAILENLSSSFLSLSDAHKSLLKEKFVMLLYITRCGDVSRLYALFTEANLVGHLNEAPRSYILKTGRNILEEGSSSLAEFKKIR
ncbi:unnamed protein product, partial [Thlaspi arvense]